MTNDLEVRHGKIFKLGYTVPNLERAVQQFATQLEIGGWLVIEKFTYAQMRYRGGPGELAVSLAVAYQDNMMYELMQPLSDSPSIFKDAIDAAGYGFHHFCLVVGQIDAEIDKYRKRGFELATEVTTSTGARAAFMDTRGSLPGMLEFMQDGPELRDFLKLVFDQQCRLEGSPRIMRI